LKALINSTIQDVSQKEGLGYDGVLGIVERRVKGQVDWSRYPQIAVLGIDEIALKKGYRDFAVIVSGRLDDGSVVILGILPDRQQSTLEAFLRSIPASLRATIHTACVDMYDNYRQALQAVLLHVQIVVDRFHVARLYRDAADQVRKAEMKRLKKTLPKAEYATLKRCRRAFWKNQGTLNTEEQAALARLFTYAPALRLVYAFRESLRRIFAQHLTKAQAQEELRTWMFLVREQNITCYTAFLDTLERFWDEISNFFVHRLTSGFVEGLNNKLKVLKRRAFGIFQPSASFSTGFSGFRGLFDVCLTPLSLAVTPESPKEPLFSVTKLARYHAFPS
jgi:transposase